MNRETYEARRLETLECIEDLQNDLLSLDAQYLQGFREFNDGDVVTLVHGHDRGSPGVIARARVCSGEIEYKVSYLSHNGVHLSRWGEAHLFAKKKSK